MESRAGRVAGWQQSRRAPQQVGRSGHVTAYERTSTGRCQTAGGVDPERHAMLIERAELGQVPMGLFEMVAEDFLELGRAIDCTIGFVRPGNEPLVKLGARSLEQSRIGRIANHQVGEAVLEGFFLRRSLVSHELPLLERHQVNWDFAPNLVVDDGLERCLDKDQADHRGRVKSPVGSHRPSTERSMPVSMSIDTSCSTKSGLPSAAATTLARARGESPA